MIFTHDIAQVMVMSMHPPPPITALMRLARRLGLARGILARSRERPVPGALLELYGFEGCSACARVRATLTELDLDYIHRSCPIGSERNRMRLKARGGRVRVPYLVDPNTGTELYESAQIVAYLESRYGAAGAAA